MSIYEDCLFCERLLNPNSKKEWYDFVILEETDEFVAVPTLGSLVPGYLLVLPKKHVFSMAHLSNAEYMNLELFCSRVVEKQRRIWGDVITFEHGSCSASQSGNACILHAHWHLVPYECDFKQKKYNFSPIESLYKAFDRQQFEYLFYRNNQGESFLSTDFEHVSQLLRRELAMQIDRPDEWDYTLFPCLDNIMQTITQWSRY